MKMGVTRLDSEPHGPLRAGSPGSSSRVPAAPMSRRWSPFWRHVFGSANPAPPISIIDDSLIAFIKTPAVLSVNVVQSVSVISSQGYRQIFLHPSRQKVQDGRLLSLARLHNRESSRRGLPPGLWCVQGPCAVRIARCGCVSCALDRGTRASRRTHCCGGQEPGD